MARNILPLTIHTLSPRRFYGDTFQTSISANSCRPTRLRPLMPPSRIAKRHLLLRMARRSSEYVGPPAAVRSAPGSGDGWYATPASRPPECVLAATHQRKVEAPAANQSYRSHRRQKTILHHLLFGPLFFPFELRQNVNSRKKGNCQRSLVRPVARPSGGGQ